MVAGNIPNQASNKVEGRIPFLRSSLRSGYELSQLISNNNVLLPSVQGVWNPFLNRPTHLLGESFPLEERSVFTPEQKSATKQLLEMMEKYKVSESGET